MTALCHLSAHEALERFLFDRSYFVDEAQTAVVIMAKLTDPSFHVKAEIRGSGNRPWAWAIYGSDPFFALDRSEAMFKSAAVAERVGRLVAQHRHPRTEIPGLHGLH